MSSITNKIDTAKFISNETDLSQIFVGHNRYDTGTYTAGGSETTLTAGTLLGRITTGGKLLPLASGAGDGSNLPIGILSQTITVAASATVTLSYCHAGDVDANKIIFDGSDTLTTAVSARTLGDRLKDLGIKAVASTELTQSDNA